MGFSDKRLTSELIAQAPNVRYAVARQPSSRIPFNLTSGMCLFSLVIDIRQRILYNSRMRFIWDPNKAERNRRRHGVPFEEAMEAFFDPNAIDEYDAEHSDDENRFHLIGYSQRRLLLVVYTEPDEATIRIISARKAEGKYQQLYERF